MHATRAWGTEEDRGASIKDGLLFLQHLNHRRELDAYDTGMQAGEGNVSGP